MITVTKMIREDLNMPKDDDFTQEEMKKVMQLETDLANVSMVLLPKAVNPE